MADIPSEIVNSGKSVQLIVTYPVKNKQVKSGEPISPTEAASQPEIALQGADPQARYTVLLVDPVCIYPFESSRHELILHCRTHHHAQTPSLVPGATSSRQGFASIRQTNSRPGQMKSRIRHTSVRARSPGQGTHISSCLLHVT